MEGREGGGPRGQDPCPFSESPKSALFKIQYYHISTQLVFKYGRPLFESVSCLFPMYFGLLVPVFISRKKLMGWGGDLSPFKGTLLQGVSVQPRRVPMLAFPDWV